MAKYVLESNENLGSLSSLFDHYSNKHEFEATSDSEAIDLADDHITRCVGYTIYWDMGGFKYKPVDVKYTLKKVTEDLILDTSWAEGKSRKDTRKKELEKVERKKLYESLKEEFEESQGTP